MMVTGHNFSIWRSPVDQGWTLWAKCKCGIEYYAKTYEDMVILTAEHFEEKLAEAEAEAEEHARG